jgi:hypothetical protein
MAMLPKIMAELASEQVIDPGPYKELKEGEPVNWDIVSHADLIVSNIIIRAKKDPLVIVQMICAVCRRLPRDPQEIDLEDVDIFMASEEGMSHLQTGKPVHKEIGDVRVGLRALLGQDLPLMAKLQLQEPENMLEVQTCMSIAEINAPGFKKPVTDLHGIRKFWREQSWDFRNEVETAIDGFWGGADTMVRYTCDQVGCEAEQEQSLPLGLSFYGLEDLKRQSRRAKSSSGKKSVRDLMQRASSRSSAKSPT